MPRAKKRTQPEEIEFLYTHDPGHRLVAASGVWGGAAGQQHLLLSFFIEKPIPPESVTHRLDGYELKGETGRRPDPGHPVIERQIQTSVYLTLDTARMVAQWITDRLDEMKRVEKQGERK